MNINIIQPYEILSFSLNFLSMVINGGITEGWSHRFILLNQVNFTLFSSPWTNNWKTKCILFICMHTATRTHSISLFPISEHQSGNLQIEWVNKKISHSLRWEFKNILFGFSFLWTFGEHTKKNQKYKFNNCFFRSEMKSE